MWTRDELYYYVSKTQGGRPAGTGKIVFYTKHDYGQVPLFPCVANRTDSALPEEEYIPLLEGAYAMIPGYNQVLTLLSNAAVFNTTPRYVIIRADGTAVLDPDTNEPLITETDNIAGLDPEYVAVIESGGGEFKQLTIENVDDLIALIELYGRQLDQTLPPEAALGASGSEEPAWGTRLKQAAANIKITPVVNNHARGLRRMTRMWARIIQNRRQEVTIYGKPSRKGRARSVRSEIILKPDNISMDISVIQDSHDAQEKIVRTQVGLGLFTAGVIGPVEFHEDWRGVDDPYGAIMASMAWQVVQTLLPQTLTRVVARVQGRLPELTPNEIEAQAGAMLDATAAVTGEPAAAAGVRQPGIEQGVTQNALPVLQGPGAAPLEGGLPV